MSEQWIEASEAEAKCYADGNHCNDGPEERSLRYCVDETCKLASKVAFAYKDPKSDEASQ